MSFPNLSALAVRERAVTLFFLMMAVIAGIYAFVSLGRAEDPAFTVRALVVSAYWPGATPEELQEQVVDRLETRVQEVAYLDKIETTIRPGQATLQISFFDYTPKAQITDLQYQVRKRMQEEAATMPAGVIGPLVNDDFGDVYFSIIALTAPGMPPRQLTREAEAIRDRLYQVPGVRKVLLLGERDEKFFIEFDNARLVNLGLQPADIFTAIGAHNSLLPAGRIETLGSRVHLRLDSDLADPDTLLEVPLQVGDRVIRLGDIAGVRRGYEDPATYEIRSAGADAVLLGVVMEEGTNGLELGDKLTQFVSREQQALPLGIDLQMLTNQAEAIAEAVNLFQIKFLVAVVVVVLVSVFAIGTRAGLVVGVAVPVTLGIAFVFMLMMGINLDRITLGALIIALGLLVDDAIIAVEMMIVKMEAGWDRVLAAAHAWTVTAAPMLLGTLVTIAGFVPIGFAKSGVAEFTGNIFWVLGITLTISWLVAVVFVPYLGVKLLPASLQHSDAPGAAYQTRNYRYLRSVVSWCVVHRKWVVGTTIGLLVVAIVAMATLVEKQFFPNSERPEVLISVYMPQGASIATTRATVNKLEALLQPLDEVRTLSSYVGAGAPRFFISYNPESPDPAFAKVLVVARDAEARDRVIALAEQAVANGQFAEARMRISRLLQGPPIPWPVAFRITGQDPLVLRSIGHQVREAMTANGHVADPHLEWDERVPVLHLVMDWERLRRLGMTPGAVSSQLQFHFDGITVTQVREDTRLVDVVARAAKAAERWDMDALNGLEILTPEGQKLPFSQLGEIQIRYEDPVITRYNRVRSLVVQGDVVGAQANDVTLAIWDKMASLRAALPPGYTLEYTGSVQESRKGEIAIQKLQPLMVGLMLTFIMLQMRSFAGTLIVVATAPLGLIGAVLALLVFQQPFGFVALLGITGLAGILMRNALILTQQVSDNFAAGMSAFEGVVEAAVQRARPVILTALAAVLAFIPLTHDSFWGPLAFVLIGGVAVGTVITLLFVPALYGLWYRIKPDT